jgi:hypothetical protein
MDDLSDPYAAAAARMAGKREADQAAARADDETPDALLARPRRNIGRKVFFGLAFLLLLQQIGAARKPPPQLAPDCANPGFKLASDTVKQARFVTYSIVGPNGRWYALGVDTNTLVRRADGGWDGVATPGQPEFRVAASVKSLTGCRHNGQFGVPFFPAGQHTVTMYDLTSGTAVEVGHRAIEETTK